MRNMFSMQYEGRDLTDSVDTVQRFCDLNNLEYVGSFVKKDDGKLVGDVVQIEGQYYLAEMVAFYARNDKRISVARFQLYKSFDPEDHLLIEECSVRVDVWDVEVDDEGPILQYAFTDVSEARKVVGEGMDFDVWIDGKQVDSEEFLKQ